MTPVAGNQGSRSHVVTAVKTLALLTTVLLLAACGTTTTGAGGSGVDLEGRTFLSTGVTEDGTARELVADTRIQISFKDGSISVNAGCNTMFGDYELDGDTLVVGELAMTMMGCPDGLAEQDAWVGDLLAAGPTVAETDGTLTVTSGTTVITLLDRKIADPDRPLVGTLWRVETLISNDAASSTPGGAEATLTFNEDGTVAVATGCNRGRGTFEQGEGTITISAVALTRMACQDERGELEQAVLKVIETPGLTATIEADSLTLTDGTTGLGLRAG